MAKDQPKQRKPCKALVILMQKTLAELNKPVLVCNLKSLMNNWINWVIFGCLIIGLFFGINKLAYGEHGKPNSVSSGSMIKKEMNG